MRYISGVALLAVLSALVFLAVRPMLRPRPNIVLVVVDALRKDHLGCYGYERDTSPFIDWLARDGLRFENAVSQSPWTTASMASMFTSRMPSRAGVHAVEGPDGMRRLLAYSVTGLGPGAYTLAEVLNEAGYETACVSANPFTSEKFGLAQGFDKHVELVFWKDADDIFEAAEKIISGRPQPPWYRGTKPLFIYLHFMDTHKPTQPRPPYDIMFPTLDGAPHELRHKLWEHETSGADLGSREFMVYRSHKLALYDSAIRQVDDRLKQLAELLVAKGLYENTVMVIASDHGEELWDHALFEKDSFRERLDECGLGYGVDHGHTMFRELLDVPLIFHGPGVPKRVYGAQVRNLDIMPTLLGLAGVDMDGLSAEGVDLLGNYNGADLPAFSEDIAYGFEKKAYQDGRYKYIRYFKGADREFLFDRRSDPAETRDVSKERPDVAARMRGSLDEALADTSAAGGRPVAMDEETKKKLRAVGYLR